MTVDEGISRVAVPSPETRDRVPQDEDLAVRDIVARLAAAWPAVAETTV